MSKKAARPVSEIDSVTVKYDLFDLPTAQHKAGLAGLLLHLGNMREPQRALPPEIVPEVVEATPTGATVRFTAKSVQGLFDDLYDASVEEVAVKSKWSAEPKRPPEEVEEADPNNPGKTRKVKRFFYDVIQARGHFLRQYLPEMDSNKDWHKLWRDMLWAIPRGNPQSRTPFNQRAAGQSCAEGKVIWEELVRCEKARQANQFYTTEVAGSLWLGAQAVNAEAIPFRGRAEQNLLLHFWPLTALIFVPQQINNDGESEFVGYCLAIPEVADLELFCEDYPLLLHNLSTVVKGFRPAEAVIDLPAQAALEFMEHLARLTAFKTEKKRTGDSISSVEYLHLIKIGNNVKSLAAGRVVAKKDLLERYEAVVGTRDRPTPYKNPLFRCGLLLALLREGASWHDYMGPIFAQRPWPFFVRDEKTPRGLSWFSADAARKFEAESDKYQQALEDYRKMSTTTQGAIPAPESPLPLIIEGMVRSYVMTKAKVKCGHDKKTKLKDLAEDAKKKVYEVKTKIASDAFLAIRSRRDEDFVDYFTSAICSVSQYFDRKNRQEEFRTVANALLNQEARIDVKTLTLLALSANS
jgi:CRISPR-associated protein Cmx8